MNTPFKSSRLEVVSSVSVVPEEPWNALARETFYTSHRWLEFVERQPGASSEYVLAWHGDALAAGLPCYEIRTEDNQLCDPVRLADARVSGARASPPPRPPPRLRGDVPPQARRCRNQIADLAFRYRHRVVPERTGVGALGHLTGARCCIFTAVHPTDAFRGSDNG